MARRLSQCTVFITSSPASAADTSITSPSTSLEPVVVDAIAHHERGDVVGRGDERREQPVEVLAERVVVHLETEVERERMERSGSGTRHLRSVEDSVDGATHVTAFVEATRGEIRPLREGDGAKVRGLGADARYHQHTGGLTGEGARRGPSCHATMRRSCALGTKFSAHPTIGGRSTRASVSQARVTARATTASHFQLRAMSNTSTRLGFSLSTICATSRNDMRRGGESPNAAGVTRVQQSLGHGQRFELGGAHRKPIRRREQVVELHREAVRAFHEGAVEVELHAVHAEHHLLAEAVVEPGAQLGQRALAVERASRAPRPRG